MLSACSNSSVYWRRSGLISVGVTLASPLNGLRRYPAGSAGVLLAELLGQAGALADEDILVIPRLEAGRQQLGAEVVCVVRPHQNPSAKSEIIVLDQGTSAFLRSLAESSSNSLSASPGRPRYRQ